MLDGPDANSLMGKIVYLHQKMPAWLRGRPQRVNDIGCMRRNVTQHLLLNMANGATVQGFAPTDSKVRSLRFTAFGYDEFAYFPGKEQETLNASVHTAPTRYFISTWHGAGNAFHDIMCRTPSTALRVSTYWWNNPERWKGAYTTENGRIKILDKAFQFPPDYPFVDDGLLRSPWVDYELSRAGNDMQTALEELYGLQAESGRKLLRPAVIEMAQETCRDPLMRGDLDKSGRNPVFREGLGDVYIWQNIVPGQGGPYAAGCDLAFGRGASYSALEVFSLTTGEQVMEFADKHIDIISFARYVADLLRWLNGSEGDGYSYVTFENNGDQANSFGGELLRLGYGNVARRKYAGRVPKRDAPTYLGTRNKDGGRALLIELGRAIYDGEATIRSAQLAHELGQFDKDEKDKPEYPRGEDGHGDRAQAAALAWDIARDRIVKITKEERESAYAEIMRPAASKRRDWAAGWKIKRGVAGL